MKNERTIGMAQHMYCCVVMTNRKGVKGGNVYENRHEHKILNGAKRPVSLDNVPDVLSIYATNRAKF
jgi:hypothetical protein